MNSVLKYRGFAISIFYYATFTECVKDHIENPGFLAWVISGELCVADFSTTGTYWTGCVVIYCQ
jgi:nucleoside-specific outer membrane channel protein Tsx